MLKKENTQIPPQSGYPKIEFNSMSREEFSKTTLMGVLQFGAETLLAEAVKAEMIDTLVVASISMSLLVKLQRVNVMATVRQLSTRPWAQ